MEITKSKFSAGMAVVTLAENSVWGGKDEYPDARKLDDDRRAVRAAAKAYCREHGLRGYEVFAADENGGHTVDIVEDIDA